METESSEEKNSKMQYKYQIEIANEIHELGLKIEKEFGDFALGEYLIALAYQYRTGRLQSSYNYMIDYLDRMKGEEKTEDEDVFENIDFDGKVH